MSRNGYEREVIKKNPKDRSRRAVVFDKSSQRITGKLIVSWMKKVYTMIATEAKT